MTRSEQPMVVVDLETTGLYNRDRIVEIAFIAVDSSGEPTDSFCTLVNPCRDIGAAHIHGVTASMCSAAPTFEDVAGTVADWLHGRVIVGHNAQFDIRFLSNEFQRVDAGLSAVAIDTMFMAHHAGLPRDLLGACEAAGVIDRPTHDALSDAMATTRLFQHLRGVSPVPVAEPATVSAAGHLHRSIRTTRRPPDGNCRSVPALNRVRPRAVCVSAEGTDVTLPYLELLDMAMADFIIDADEAAQLHTLARELGLTTGEIALAERMWFDDLVRAAEADGEITEVEHQRITDAGYALGIDVTINPTTQSSRPESLAGQLIVFTGDPDLLIGDDHWTRPLAEAAARSAGAECARNVTKKTTVVVACDAESMSGKSKKAREYGIPIIDPAAFLAMLEKQRT